MALLKDWFGWEGPYTAQQRRTEEQHKKKMAQMGKLLETEEGQRLLRQAQTVALEQRNKAWENLTPEERKQKLLYPYGGRSKGTATANPMVKAAEDVGKIAKAKEQMESVEEIPPETAAFFDAAEKSVKDKVGWKEPVINPKTGKPRRIFDKSGKLLGTRNVEGTATTPEGKVVDNRELFSDGVNPFADTTGPIAPKVGDTKEDIKPLEEYFQAGTETVPEENIPKTYEQLGIATTEDQQTFQEMQDALPDRDLRLEYENDPEGMKRLMRLWREKKLTKKNLHKAFSMIRQQARQSLGLS